MQGLGYVSVLALGICITPKALHLLPLFLHHECVSPFILPNSVDTPVLTANSYKTLFHTCLNVLQAYVSFTRVFVPNKLLVSGYLEVVGTLPSK